MIGAIAGDIIGSRFEHGQAANYDFELFHHHCRFTDDRPSGNMHQNAEAPSPESGSCAQRRQ